MADNDENEAFNTPLNVIKLKKFLLNEIIDADVDSKALMATNDWMAKKTEKYALKLIEFSRSALSKKGVKAEQLLQKIIRFVSKYKPFVGIKKRSWTEGVMDPKDLTEELVGLPGWSNFFPSGELALIRGRSSKTNEFDQKNLANFDENNFEKAKKLSLTRIKLVYEVSVFEKFFAFYDAILRAKNVPMTTSLLALMRWLEELNQRVSLNQSPKASESSQSVKVKSPLGNVNRTTSLNRSTAFSQFQLIGMLTV